MKRLGLIILVMASTALAVTQPQWTQPTSWQQLKRGLTDTQVKHILDEPFNREANPKAALWH